MIVNKTCLCFECYEEGTSAIAESLPVFSRFEKLKSVILEAGDVYDVSELSALSTLEHLELPYTREIVGLESVLAANTNLADLQLSRLTLPISSQSLRKLKLCSLNAQGTEALLLSQLPSLQVLETPGSASIIRITLAMENCRGTLSPLCGATGLCWTMISSCPARCTVRPLKI